ncbi:MAG: glycosyltransferase family 2 protein [Treponema sp.]|nr:glycosyltransferase family 2 protein [Treponema sp.]
MIDILLSTYNGENFLRDQLDSLLSQTYKDFRILVRDDCSNDKTIMILNEYKYLYPEKIVLIGNNDKNLGSTKSFFEILRHSDAEFIMFCDQDDVWKNDKLEIFLNYIKEKSLDITKPILIHSAVEVVDSNLCTLEETTNYFNKNKCGMEKTFTWQIFQNDVTGCTVMINAPMKNIINQMDYNKNKIIQHDWFLAQVAYLCNGKFFIPVPTIKYRQHSNNVLGARKLSFIQRIMYKISKGVSYPFYDQVESLLNCNIPISKEMSKLANEFISIRKKNKIRRIMWHINHNFLREGNIFYKIYQLILC